MVFSRVLLSAAFAILPLGAYAESECAPVFDDAVLNLSYECLNDSTAMIVDSSQSDINGWQYSPDSFLDGLTGSTVGGGTYEMYGIAFRETQTEIWIALSGNVPIGGVATSLAEDGIISWGDLFLNLTGNNFLTASNAQALYAMRFSVTNNSGAALPGLYSSVDAKSVVSTNHGLATYASYETHVIARGGTPDLGIFDTGATQTYYSTAISYGVISQSAWLGSIEFLSDLQLAESGFNPTVLPGLYTIAFRFNKRLIVDECGVPAGDGTSCLDCAGVACGNSALDDCGVCGGSNTTCLDCTGTPFGTAVLDRCDVCAGDGSSCLGCVSKSETARYDESKALLRKQLSSIMLALKSKRYSKVFEKQVLRLARKAYRRAMLAIGTLPAVVTQCENAQFCLSVDSSSASIRQISSESSTLVKLSRSLFRRIMFTFEGGVCEGDPLACRERVRARNMLLRKIRNDAIRQHRMLKKTVSLIEVFNSQC
jgi:hypothetical protein